MSASSVLGALQSSHAAAGRADLAKLFQELASLYEKKLYHQVTLKSLELVKNEYYSGSGADELIKLYGSFFKDLEAKSKPLSMAQIVAAVAGGHRNVADQIAFLEKKASDLKSSPDSHALLVTLAASSYSSERNFEKAKQLLDQVQGMLDGALGLDPLVYSNFYRVLAIFHKSQVHAGEFYKAGLLYLAYTPVDTIALPVQKLMARDLALAGLVAEDVYGLGELLSHPVAQTLRQDSDNAWLLELVNAFNSGKIAEWGTLKSRHAAQIQQHASVAQHMDLLEQKIRILALIELVWSRPADGRTLPFKDIASATHLPLDSVELLVMRALALGLIKGELDQVQGVVVVSQVLPRVLSPDQIAAARDRVKAWKEHVQATLVTLESGHHELLK